MPLRLGDAEAHWHHIEPSGILSGAADGLAALLSRMAEASMEVERIMPGSAAYRYLT